MRKACKSAAAAFLAALLAGTAAAGAQASPSVGLPVRGCPTCGQGPAAGTPRALDLYAAPTSPIAEPDWDLLLRERASEAERLGLMRQAKLKTRATLAQHARVPVDLRLPKARATRVRETVLIDEAQAARLSAPVRDVLTGFVRRYVFFDADDPAQRAYVLGLPGIGVDVKPVATAGNVVKAAEAMRLRLYADQGGVLKRRFGLTAAPSLVEVLWDARRVAARVTETRLPLEADTRRGRDAGAQPHKTPDP